MLYQKGVIQDKFRSDLMFFGSGYLLVIIGGRILKAEELRLLVPMLFIAFPSS